MYIKLNTIHFLSAVNFHGRRLAIATMHGKEKVIGPVLERELGVTTFVTSDLNTDQFGTFTGEIEREGSPLDAARKKCYAASIQYDCTLAVASEGSFGPHPTIFFAPCDDEILMLIDTEHDLEIKARMLTTETNFSGRELKSWEEIEEFASLASFPSHGLIVRKSRDDNSDIAKGIHSWTQLKREAARHLETTGKVYIETDMRAMHNPTRMKAIEQAAMKLAEATKSLCPACASPGFSVTEVASGLPCEQCGSPTKSTLSYIYCCQKCAHTEQKKHPHGKTTESAMYCDWCNP